MKRALAAITALGIMVLLVLTLLSMFTKANAYVKNFERKAGSVIEVLPTPQNMNDETPIMSPVNVMHSYICTDGILYIIYTIKYNKNDFRSTILPAFNLDGTLVQCK